jgi:hypothetical protein
VNRRARRSRDRGASPSVSRKMMLPAVAAVPAAVMVLGHATPAEALCNNLARNYAGQYSTNGYEYNGIERYISVPDSRLYYAYQFIAHWIGVDKVNSQYCSAHPGDLCWTQVGHTAGLEPAGYTHEYHVYAEASNAGGGYSLHTYDEYPTAVGANKFYTVYNSTPPDGFGFKHFETNYGGTHPLMEGFMPWARGTGQATSEMYDSLSGQNCPTIGYNNSYVFFGTNGSGGASSGYRLFNSSVIPNNWSEWTGPVGRNQNYEHGVIVHNSAFKNRGGNI